MKDYTIKEGRVTEIVIKDKQFRKAVIRQRNGVFEGCTYEGVNAFYNLDDWEFLTVVGYEILKQNGREL